MLRQSFNQVNFQKDLIELRSEKKKNSTMLKTVGSPSDKNKVFTSTFYCDNCQKEFKVNCRGNRWVCLDCYRCSKRMHFQKLVNDVSDKMYT